MTMNAGTVSVDDDGNETYTPNNSTNAAKALYLLLLNDQANNQTPSTVTTPPTVTIDPVTFAMSITPGTVITTNVPVQITPDSKKAQAKLANTMASWMVTYLKANAVVTGTIDTTTGSTTQPVNNGKLQ
jgi:hypothetical protein